jgi:tetratricopeptide (TPR) repeat protein
MGKTFLARDIGVRLGSPTGYESAQQGNVAWSGILDLYDPDTNSNRGIERRLIEAFSSTGLEFEAYRDARSLYDIWFKGGIVGSSLESQRRKVEEAFAEGLTDVSRERNWRLVMAFDTVERLENALDVLQQEQPRDTAAVMDWLIYQITQLESGTVLLFGRRASHFFERLKAALKKADEEKPQHFELRPIDLGPLNEDEVQDFLAHRMRHYPKLEHLLDETLTNLLVESTGGNPLLLDLALLSLIESQDPSFVRQALQEPEDFQAVERALLNAYINSYETPERQIVLRYLALARNGLFPELIRALDRHRADALIAELREMERLPFIKVRDISVTVPNRQDRVPRRTYFLHDAMYTLCDELWLRPEQVKRDSQQLVDWYEEQLRSRTDHDLLVESLFYRMRADPVAGYHWYLQQADQAIRSAQTGLDMRLGDAMGLFLASAAEADEDDEGQTLSSPIDHANIQALMPQIFDDFQLDSLSLWIKRYTWRGKTKLAVQIGKNRFNWAEETFQQNPARYHLSFADFLLWYGQAVMYGYEIDEALKLYRRVIELLTAFDTETSAEDSTPNVNDFKRWRLSLVMGRTYNNLGYTHWMYKGQYRLALREFQQAIRLFRAAGLAEELANTNDNMGRVHALLGEEFQATKLIRKGQETRQELGLTYRAALSANSLAMVLIRFGRTVQAFKAVEDAIIHFRRTEVTRGIGLGLLTRGMIHRSMAEMYEELSIPVDEAIRHTDKAETDLKEAVRYFSTLVHEPIREVQARNEIACCYRARFLLLKTLGANETEREMALVQGRMFFRRAIELAKKYNYIIDILDSMQDLAVLLLRDEQYAQVEHYLAEIRDRIPKQYTVRPHIGLIEIDEAERVDAYYKLMGQVEMLEAAMVYEKGRRQAREMGKSGEQPKREAWLETAHHYLLAVSYFSRFGTESFVRGLTFGRIYKRFENCDLDLVHEITQEYMPQRVKEYALPDELVRSLFQDVFGLFD